MYRYNFFYKTQNLINGKFYYGIHSTNNLNDGYLGSGLNIKQSIKKHGKKNFRRDVLIFFESREKLFEYESKFISDEILKNPECYNISPGGNRGGDTSGMVNVYDSRSGKNMMVSINDPKYISGELVSVLKGFVNVRDSSGSIIKVKIDDDLTDILDAVGGRPLGSKGAGGWHLSEGAKEKLRKYRTGQKQTEKTKKRIGNSNLGHKRQIGNKHSQYNKKWIIHPSTNKRLLVDKEKISDYFTNGWILGRKLKK